MEVIFIILGLWILTKIIGWGTSSNNKTPNKYQSDEKLYSYKDNISGANKKFIRGNQNRSKLSADYRKTSKSNFNTTNESQDENEDFVDLPIEEDEFMDISFEDEFMDLISDVEEKDKIDSSIDGVAEHEENYAGFTVFAYTTYYPVRYKGAPQGVRTDRKLVYDFKDGLNYSYVSKLICRLISQKIPIHSSNNYILCTIPASTDAKNIKRFSKFSEITSRDLGIQNGFNVIQRKMDRGTMREEGYSISRTKGLVYNKDRILNKNIILFDDVITKGRSFIENARELKKRGAKEVYGVFLAKTFDSYVNGDPYWARS